MKYTTILSDHSVVCSIVAFVAAFSFYFAGVMVRLMLVTAPAIVLLSAVAISHMLTAYARQMHAPPAPAHKASQKHAAGVGQPLAFQKELAFVLTVGFLSVELSP